MSEPSGDVPLLSRLGGARQKAPGGSPNRAYDLMRTCLRNGMLLRGDLLVEDRLTKALGASRNSVRKALQMLASEGFVTRQVRVGTVVESVLLELEEERFTSATPFGSRNHQFITHLRESVEVAPTVVRDRLRLETDRVRISENLISMNGGVIGMRTLYTRPGTRRPRPGAASDMTTSFAHVHGAPIGSVDIHLDAVPCEAAIAALLEIDAGAPLLRREMLVADIDGIPRELMYIDYRGDRVSISSHREFGPGAPRQTQ